MRKKTNEEFQAELRQLREQGHDVYTDDKYINAKTKIWFYCLRKHRWKASPSGILCGHGCPYCSGNLVIIGKTSLWDTRPDVASLLQDRQDGYRYSEGSCKKTNFICPICGTTNYKNINNVCRYGFVCNACSDGVSYPQKFARAFLKQLPVSNVQYEYSPAWLKPFRYDCYFEYLGNKYVLEMDGELGHGGKQFGTKEKDVSGLKRDVQKDSMAFAHDISVIRIDCKYKIDRRFEHVKKNILNSRLSILFDLSNIDWIECDRQGQAKLVLLVAELYNQGLSIPEIQTIIGHHRKTIGRWLKQANNIGLCGYNAQESLLRSVKNSTSKNISVNRYTKNNEYVDTFASMATAEKETNISRPNICKACDNPNRSAGGYRWYKTFNINQPDKSKIILTI